MSARDKAGARYWEDSWITRDLPPPLNSADRRLTNEVHRRFDELFRAVAGWRSNTAGTLLEIGCGRSQLLPYFHREFGFSVTGIDYSPTGCDQARAILEREGVEGRVVEADLFDPPADLLRSFDAVCSFGVVEHFEDTASAVAAFARFVRPGGVVVTTAPNMGGTVGWLQRLLNRPAYEVHKPVTPSDLARAHNAAGLEVVHASYFMSTNYGVVNVGMSRAITARRIVGAVLTRLSMAVWAIERLAGRWPATSWFAPYVVCVARSA